MMMMAIALHYYIYMSKPNINTAKVPSLAADVPIDSKPGKKGSTPVGEDRPGWLPKAGASVRMSIVSTTLVSRLARPRDVGRFGIGFRELGRRGDGGLDREGRIEALQESHFSREGVRDGAGGRGVGGWRMIGSDLRAERSLMRRGRGSRTRDGTE
jgi:hypothetical protein